MTQVLFNDIPLSQATTYNKSHGYKRNQFGDGYSQIVTDVPNAVQESWKLRTVPITEAECWSLESYLLERKGRVISWEQPYRNKSFSKKVVSKALELGYNEVSTATLRDLSANPVVDYLTSAYSLDQRSGKIEIINSTLIPNGTLVGVEMTLLAGNYVVEDGWNVNIVSGAYLTLDFGLRRVYV